MPDPCDECLLKPCCTEICERKQLYTNYIKDGEKHYITRRGSLILRAIRDSSYKNYLETRRKVDESNQKIFNRSGRPSSSSISPSNGSSSSSSSAAQRRINALKNMKNLFNKKY
jgi:hypothetical protein